METRTIPEWVYASHPYTMKEGCFFNNDCHQTFSCWDDFKKEWIVDCDPELNLLFRWDVEFDKSYKMIMKLYFILQRKAYPFSVFVEIKIDDLQEIEEYLKERTKNIKDVWSPFL